MKQFKMLVLRSYFGLLNVVLAFAGVMIGDFIIVVVNSCAVAIKNAAADVAGAAADAADVADAFSAEATDADAG